MEWTVTIEGRDELGEVRRAQLRIEKGFERLKCGEIGLSIDDGKMTMTSLQKRSSAIASRSSLQMSKAEPLPLDCHRRNTDGADHWANQLRWDTVHKSSANRDYRISTYDNTVPRPSCFHGHHDISGAGTCTVVIALPRLLEKQTDARLVQTDF